MPAPLELAQGAGIAVSRGLTLPLWKSMCISMDDLWMQLDLFTEESSSEVDNCTDCELCGWPVDSADASIVNGGLLGRCMEPGCPQSTGPTTTAR